jgi:2-dehydro-3-deoxyphosphogluconate aldolase/(4S)-4-hydroxy-2-oxoglutarate aldolase
MSQKVEILNLIVKQGILPLYFYEDVDVSINILLTMYQSGIRTIEYADRGAKALSNFKKLREVCDSELPGMYLGIGTIKNLDSAKSYIDAGTDFIVCPGVVEAVGEIALNNDLFWIPGCMTPSEIIHVENMGAQLIKLFPGNNLEIKYIDAIKAIFPDILFMPTGGIEMDQENMRKWFNAGVSALGGSKLITKSILELRKYDELKVSTIRVLNLIQAIRADIKQ